MYRVLGIDPGTTGGAGIVEVLAPRRVRLIDATDVPMIGDGVHRSLHVSVFADFVRRNGPISFCAIERAFGMPRQAGRDVYMRLTGQLEATVLCCGVRLRRVEAQTWKKHLGLSAKEVGAFAERRSVELAAKIFSRDAERFKLVKSHNVAEACMIAAWAGGQMFDAERLAG